MGANVYELPADKPAGKGKRGESAQVVAAFDPNKDIMPAARSFRAMYESLHCRRLIYVQGEFFGHSGSHYERIERTALHACIYGFLEDLGGRPKRSIVEDVEHALRGICYVQPIQPPAYLPGFEGPPSSDLVPVRNGLLWLPSRELLAPDPGLFNTTSLPIDYSPAAPSPATWLAFMHSIWGDDYAAIEAWQEVMGLFCLTDITSFQKAALIIGPKRSGKGTLLRVMRALAGEANVAAPTLAAFGANFGLQSLPGKRLIQVTDARIGKTADLAAIAETVLRITGEDAISVPRKFAADWMGRLPGRIVICSNELPALLDASGALASRFLVFRMSRSFFGNEDHTLTDRLLAELPGILLWALDGLDRLRERGRLLQPESGRELLEAMADLASPISQFIEDELHLCEGSEFATEKKQHVFAAWRDWCHAHGNRAGSEAMFAKSLRAAVPFLEDFRPRDGSPDRQRRFRFIRLKTPRPERFEEL